MKKLILVILMFIMCISFASALDIALTPGSLNFGTVLREGYSEGRFKFTTYSSELVTVKLYHSDPDNPMNRWLYMHAANGSEIKIGDSLTLDRNNPLNIYITFEPDSDSPNGEYSTTVGATIESGSDSDLDGGDTVAKIKTGVSIKLVGTIDDVEILSCKAVNLNLNSPELGELGTFSARVKNTGNILLNPRIEIDIWDKLKTRVVKTVTGNLGLIKSTVTADTQFSFETLDLPPGDYVASVNLGQCNINNKLMTFRVLEIGSKGLDGIIKFIDIPEVVYGLNPFQVIVDFENLGDDSTVARFSGGVYKDGILIKTLESTPITVGAKESVELDAGYFTPAETRNQEDRYVLRGRVYYGNKQTKEVTKVFFVNKTSKGLDLNVVLIIGMIAVIMVLMAMIIKQNKR